MTDINVTFDPKVDGRPEPAREQPKPQFAEVLPPGAMPATQALIPILEGRVVPNIEGRLTMQWRATTPAGTPFEHVLDPRYWTHVALHFHVGDKIHVETDDRTYYAELYVRHCERTFAHVEKTLYAPFVQAIPAPLQDHHEVRYMGPYLRWAVLDLKDGKPVKDKFPSRESADSFLQSYLRSHAN